MSDWELLPETTLQSAKDFGAVWVRDQRECIVLPGYIVRRLGHIPDPYVANMILETMGAK